MNKIAKILLIGFLIVSCKEKASDEKISERKVEFNQQLADELRKMAEMDQIAAYILLGKYEKLSKEEWNSFKDSVFVTHQKRLVQIFDNNGFVGIDLAGEEGSMNFWLMVQHADHTPDFQEEVLEKMKIEVEKGNADPSNYGLLVDRVKLNIGQKQVYGTQVDYNFEIAQAYPKNLADSANVNERRKSIGLEPIEEYLNQMTLMNFEMNKQYYLEKGITKPKLYKIE